MTALLNRDYRFAGTIKFNISVSIEKLADIITEMKAKSPERWVDLHIRGAGDDGTHYIAFHYILEDGKKKTYKKAGNNLIQYLRERLGTSPKVKGQKADSRPMGVIGWSISLVKVVI